MNILPRGFLRLVALLALGFAFTELTILALNAWVMHETQLREQTSVAGQDLKPD